MQDLLKQSGIPFTVLITSIFYENMVRPHTYRKVGDEYTFSLNAGRKAHPSNAVADIGATAAGVSNQPFLFLA